MEREYEDKRWKALFETIQGVQRRADYRAGLVAAMVLNSVRGDTDAKIWDATDFFPHLKRNPDGTPIEEAKPRERTTAETVAYLKAGFGLFFPPGYSQRVGQPD